MMLMNSETKTARPGSPIAAKAPSASSPPAHGILAASPPSSLMRRVPVRAAMTPTRMNRSAEYSPCVTCWKTAPLSPTAFPEAAPSRIKPRVPMDE